jgi:hypothetical protein
VLAVAALLFVFAGLCSLMALNPGEGGAVGTVFWSVSAAFLAVVAVVVLQQR